VPNRINTGTIYTHASPDSTAADDPSAANSVAANTCQKQKQKQEQEQEQEQEQGQG